MKRLMLMAVLLVASCSAIDVAKTVMGGAVGGGPSLDVEVVAGDKNQEVQVGDKIAAKAVQITNELDYVLLIVAILGWVLPTPGQLWKAGTGWMRRGKA